MPEDLDFLIRELSAVRQRVSDLERLDPLSSSGYPALSGLTAGQPLRATGAAAAAFGALDLANANAVAGVLPVSYLGTDQSPQFDGLQIGAANGAGTAIQVNRTDAGASNVVTGLRIDRYSTSAPAAGIGARIIFGLEDDTQVRDAFRLDVTSTNITDATFKARAFFGIYDVTAVREGFRLESDGANPMIGFLGSAARARPTGYTQTYATATRTHSNITATAPSAYAAGANGYSTGAKAQEVRDAAAALVTDMANVKQVLNQVIDDLQSYGLLA